MGLKHRLAKLESTAAVKRASLADDTRRWWDRFLADPANAGLVPKWQAYLERFPEDPVKNMGVVPFDSERFDEAYRAYGDVLDALDDCHEEYVKRTGDAEPARRR